MLETLTAGLVLAAVAGLTTIGIKSPQGYERLRLSMSTLFWPVLACACGYIFGHQSTLIRLTPFINYGEIPDGSSVMELSSPPYLWMILGAVLYFYLCLGIPFIAELLQPQEAEPNDSTGDAP